MAAVAEKSNPAFEAAALAIKKQENKIAKLEASGSEPAAIVEAKRRLTEFKDAEALLKKPEAGGKKAPKKAPPPRKIVENKTPAGQKKILDAEMAAAYEPQAVELAWNEWWEHSGFFKPEAVAAAAGAEKQDPFVMVIPPPNVTGQLHIGHALTVSVEDTLVRWNRMRGRPTLWVPGTDHAGIATQAVVERKLLSERGLTRHDLGREPFIKEVWAWKEDYGHAIDHQLRRMGTSLDWSRYAFTMDETRSRAVQEAFVRMFDKGLIYRATRLVNWCCRLNTALSDIEVESEELAGPTRLAVPGHGDKKYDFGMLWSFAYKIYTGPAGAVALPADAPEPVSDEEIVIATTRPETLLGDTGVAVHPEDPRYKHLHGKYVWHPFRRCAIPIVTDPVLVDMAFGTGAVKITPAHDANDYEAGNRNNLERINMLNDDGTINEVGGALFAGMKRYDCRNKIIEEMKARNLYRGDQPNPMNLQKCSRTGDIIEPLLKPQWWVAMAEPAKAAADAVRSGDLRIVPESHTDTWFRWMDNCRDWCISRQLWWGHRVPAFLAWRKGDPQPQDAMTHWVSARDENEARAKAAARLGVSAADVELKQDPDVLDTWFSSGLFPFATMGWPEDTSDLQRYYPISLMETGYDILFFWVARMVVMGMILTGKVPFPTVYLHAMVRDAHGNKMSKSSGNVIDPIDVIEGITLEELHAKLFSGNLDPREIAKAIRTQREDFAEGIYECGTDALRFALCAYTSQGTNINLDIGRVVGYRFFCNKLWNATRFALSNLKGFTPAATQGRLGDETGVMRWILSRMNKCAKTVNDSLAAFDLSTATSAIHQFWLYELCDVYLESMKPIMNGSDERLKLCAQETLYTCLDNGLRMLHPVMPFVTEELWQRLPRRASDTAQSIMLSPFPAFLAEYDDAVAETEVELMNLICHAARALRADYGLKPSDKSKVWIVLRNPKQLQAMAAYTNTIGTLALSDSVRLVADKAELGEDIAPNCAVHVVNGDVDVCLLLKGLVDPAAEIAKLTKQADRINFEKSGIEKRRADTVKYSKVPAEVQAKDGERLVALEKEASTIAASIAMFEKMRGGAAAAAGPQ